jgi:hypothetical protein
MVIVVGVESAPGGIVSEEPSFMWSVPPDGPMSADALSGAGCEHPLGARAAASDTRATVVAR